MLLRARRILQPHTAALFLNQVPAAPPRVWAYRAQRTPPRGQQIRFLAVGGSNSSGTATKRLTILDVAPPVKDRKKGQVWWKNGQVQCWDGKVGRWMCYECAKDGVLTQANFSSKDGKDGSLKRLCATHAKQAGSHVVPNPCRDCPDGAKLQAAYPDEHGKPRQLCAKHARMRGSYVVQNPCRDCPDGAKLQAHYPDRHGRPNQLCAAHARAEGSYVAQGPAAAARSSG